jgi:hypothetical protein
MFLPENFDNASRRSMKISSNKPTVDKELDSTNEGTFPDATRRLTRDLCHFVVLDENSKSANGFLPICGSTRVIGGLVDFRPIMRNECKI